MVLVFISHLNPTRSVPFSLVHASMLLFESFSSVNCAKRAFPHRAVILMEGFALCELILGLCGHSQGSVFTLKYHSSSSVPFGTPEPQFFSCSVLVSTSGAGEPLLS